MGVTAAIPKPKPLGHPGDVRIHGKFLPAETEKEHNVSCLFAHSWQGKKPFFRVIWREIFEEIQGEFPPLLPDAAQDVQDAPGPLLK